MKRVLATSFLVLVCACTGYSEAAQSVWDAADLPDSLRAMIHLTSAELPPYPMEDSTLVDPLQWPDSVAFLNRWFYLEVTATKADVQVWGSKRVIRPGWALHLGYSRPWKGSRKLGGPDLAVGPSYAWNETGRLYRRIWYEPDTVTYRSIGYVTRPSGALFMYGVSEREADPEVEHHLMESAEYFEQDGKLVGFSYKRTGEPSRFYWKGRSVSSAEWDERYKNMLGELLQQDNRKLTPSTSKGPR